MWSHSPEPGAVRQRPRNRETAGHGPWRPPADDGQHCWKACWGQPLKSSNLLSSAILTSAYVPEHVLAAWARTARSLILSLIRHGSAHHARVVSAGQAHCSCRGRGGVQSAGDLASRVLSGTGRWLDWLEDLDRHGLIGELLAEGVIDEAAATATPATRPRRACPTRPRGWSSSP